MVLNPALLEFRLVLYLSNESALNSVFSITESHKTFTLAYVQIETDWSVLSYLTY